MVFRITVSEKQRSAAARTNQPVRAVKRWVAIPNIAKDSSATAQAANKTARSLSTRGFYRALRILDPEPMSAQYIFTTYKLSRRFPPDRQVLSDISLSFYPGAKIGVLGYNGAGKSTLLRIMAQIDTEFDGQAQLAPNATVGLLEQEPHLDESKDVKG